MQVEVRDTIIGLINTAYPGAFPGVPIVYDNTPFDWNKPPPRFVEVEVAFYGGRQIGISDNPKTRLSGYVYISAFLRYGLGSKSSLQVLDWFTAQLEYARPGRIQFQACEPDGTRDRNGYFVECLKLPFFADPT